MNAPLRILWMLYLWWTDHKQNNNSKCWYVAYSLGIFSLRLTLSISALNLLTQWTAICRILIGNLIYIDTILGVYCEGCNRLPLVFHIRINVIHCCGSSSSNLFSYLNHDYRIHWDDFKHFFSFSGFIIRSIFLWFVCSNCQSTVFFLWHWFVGFVS